MKIKTDKFEITATAEYQRDVMNRFNDGHKKSMWEIKVALFDIDDNKGCHPDYIGTSDFSFEFYTPPKEELDSYDIGNAIYCSLSDALSSRMAYEDFCEEFGYEAMFDCGNCRVHESDEVYRACGDSFDTWPIDEDEMCALLNEISEEYA